ncbi:SdiA-regulated domain-containing protein [Ferruginibacter paludis]|uniref:SdiA-regulated domain-containing protein n=1 Tax=Ferruginibacter paludis TaxID=1310417 RepID=UPI0025B30D8E|nr:SdiA-regulated domain-containing protein [Ferruginibacter paludis]MDN3657285.1 SdiA-regulated domain-containing protein [Ferruginibacter paludis]
MTVLVCANCNSSAQFGSPAGYDFTRPSKKTLPAVLHEISGIAVDKQTDSSLLAIEDEDGKLFSFSMNDKALRYSKFGKKGDYEDVTILKNNQVAVLKSDGSIFLFREAAMQNEKIDSVQIYDHILPEGEYEGLFADDNTLITLCKNCPGDKQKKEVSVYKLQPAALDSLHMLNSFQIDISAIQAKDEDGKIKFHPSGIAKHPVTKEWFIISSVNKLLLVLDGDWKVKTYFKLNPALFNQPEGISFNSKGDLYISNEGGEGAATVLFFKYLPGGIVK